jgi:hypothetical protein
VPLHIEVDGFAIIETVGVEPEFELTTILMLLDVTVVATKQLFPAIVIEQVITSPFNKVLLVKLFDVEF